MKTLLHLMLFLTRSSSLEMEVGTKAGFESKGNHSLNRLRATLTLSSVLVFLLFICFLLFFLPTSTPSQTFTLLFRKNIFLYS